MICSDICKSGVKVAPSLLKVFCLLSKYENGVRELLGT